VKDEQRKIDSDGRTRVTNVEKNMCRVRGGKGYEKLSNQGQEGPGKPTRAANEMKLSRVDKRK